MESDSEWSELNEEVEENSKNDHHHWEILSQSNMSEPSIINYGEQEVDDHVINMNENSVEEDEKKKSDEIQTCHIMYAIEENNEIKSDDTIPVPQYIEIELERQKEIVSSLREEIRRRDERIIQTQEQLNEAKEEIKEYKQHVDQQNQEIIQLRRENQQILRQMQSRGNIIQLQYKQYKKKEQKKMAITRYSNGKKSKHHGRLSPAKVEHRAQTGIHRLTYDNRRKY